MLSQELIESALQITKKSIEDVTDWIWITMSFFSYPKFCYYLLSHEFIEKYSYQKWYSKDIWRELHKALLFWEAIYEYQKWNEQPLIDLLSKI